MQKSSYLMLTFLLAILITVWCSESEDPAVKKLTFSTLLTSSSTVDESEQPVSTAVYSSSVSTVTSSSIEWVYPSFSSYTTPSAVPYYPATAYAVQITDLANIVTPKAMEYHADELFVADAWEKKIHRISLSSDNLTGILSTYYENIISPSFSYNDILFVGTAGYVTEEESGNIRKIDDNSVVGSIGSDGGFIASDGVWFYMTEFINSPNVYANYMGTLLPLPITGSATLDFARGIEFLAGKIYVCDFHTPNGGEIFQLDQYGTITAVFDVKTLVGATSPMFLTTNGEYLFFNQRDRDNIQNPNDFIAKLDPVAGSVEVILSSTTTPIAYPIDVTAGIAFHQNNNALYFINIQNQVVQLVVYR